MTQEQRESTSLVGAFREATLTVKGIACAVILAFGGLVTSPAVAAVKQEVQKIQWSKPKEQSAELSNTLKKVHELLDKLSISTSGQAVSEKSGNAETFTTEQVEVFKSTRQQLNNYQDQLASLDKNVLTKFAAVKTHLLKHHLPQVILDREVKAESTYKARMAALMTELRAASAAKDNSTFQNHMLKVREQLNKEMKHHPKTHFDPNNLPNSRLKPNFERKPFTTKNQFTEAGFVSNPFIQVASLSNNFDISHMPSAQNPAYLAATTEVTLSPAIKAEAAALDYNPVEIYNWVHNNVVWQPTWGAVQSADLTLSAQRGNAFDISSLLIALYRASGIPARYVQGTIEIPEAQFRNWMGGFQDINKAIEYASSGGVPVVGIISGGKITKVQMEHVWVEAAVDYNPSRGERNKSADTWVPIDASYKQYTFKKALDAASIAGIDPQKLANDFISSGAVDQANSSISGLDISEIQNSEVGAETNIDSYVNQNLSNAAIGDMIGGRKIVAEDSAILSSSLANHIVVIGARYGSLPSSMEQTISFALGVDALGEPNSPVSFPWPLLNNQKVTLSFRPATASDVEALQSLLPDPLTDISQLPTSIPAYLIHVIPELKINGKVVVSGPETTLGQSLTFVFSPHFVGRQTIQKTYDVIAGSYLDVAVVAGNVATSTLENLRNTVLEQKSILASQDVSQITSLTRDDLLGNMFYAGMLGYYSQYISLSYLLGLQQKSYHDLAAGIGTFGYEPHVNYIFGIPNAVNGGGAVMNVPIISVLGTDNESSGALLNYSLEVGSLSSLLEGTVPQQMFQDPAQPSEAVSAISALKLANEQGQKIYEITPANESTVLPNIHHSNLVMQEIEAALAAGKDVVTHSDDISVSGWSGAGYLLLDPVTGDGAYKIGGGTNGSFFKLTGILVPVFSLDFGFKEALAKIGGAAKVAEVFGSIASFLSLFGFLLGILKISLNCNTSAESAVILLYAMSVIATIAITIVAATFLGPLGAFLVGAILDQVVDRLNDKVLESPICK